MGRSVVEGEVFSGANSALEGDVVVEKETLEGFEKVAGVRLAKCGAIRGEFMAVGFDIGGKDGGAGEGEI